MAEPSARVKSITLARLQIAVLSAWLILSAPETGLVREINAQTLALELAETMPSVEWSTIVLYVHVAVGIAEILLRDVE
jgi:hypothetical protein